ncbi:MAG: hypothetical protein OXG65_08260 [Chloroflexi bacterium]|nr:hypothetical protein [Chloroflexota bacterium]
MRWIRTIVAGLAAALAAIALSVSLVTADDCNQPAPADFRSDVAWDGAGLHHQSQDVQDLFSSVWGTEDDLHVRTWAWQHNCRTQPRDEAGDPAGVSSIPFGLPPELRDESDVNIAYVGTQSRCHRTPWPGADQSELFAAGEWYFCNERTGEWVKRKRARPGIDYATDDQLVAPDVGHCAAGFTHYDPISRSCIKYPDGPDV